jgi:hypothetical protein
MRAEYQFLGTPGAPHEVFDRGHWLIAPSAGHQVAGGCWPGWSRCCRPVPEFRPVDNEDERACAIDRRATFA